MTLLKLLSESKPDIIVITGDLIDAHHTNSVLIGYECLSVHKGKCRLPLHLLRNQYIIYKFGINTVYTETRLFSILQNPGLNVAELLEAGDDAVDQEEYEKALIFFNTAFHLEKSVCSVA